MSNRSSGPSRRERPLYLLLAVGRRKQAPTGPSLGMQEAMILVREEYEGKLSTLALEHTQQLEGQRKELEDKASALEHTLNQEIVGLKKDREAIQKSARFHELQVVDLKSEMQRLREEIKFQRENAAAFETK